MSIPAPEPAINRAIREIGLTTIAKALKVSPPAVAKWRAAGVPADRAPAIETATGGEIRCEDLRPDLTWERDAHGRVVAYRVPVANGEAA